MSYDKGGARITLADLQAFIEDCGDADMPPDTQIKVDIKLGSWLHKIEADSANRAPAPPQDDSISRPGEPEGYPRYPVPEDDEG